MAMIKAKDFNILLLLLLYIPQFQSKQHYGMQNLNIQPYQKHKSDLLPLVQDTLPNENQNSRDFSKPLKEENLDSRINRHGHKHKMAHSDNVIDNSAKFEPKSENLDIVDYMVEISEDLKSLKRQMANLKYENHLVYKQVKKLQSKCGNEVQSKYHSYTDIQSDEPASQDLVTACPADFIWNAETLSCYNLMADRVTWKVARKRCQSMGADLVSIETGREQRFLNQAASKRPDTRHCDFWTGGSDEKAEGKWHWVANNKRLSYLNWNHDEPNNGAHDEHCMQMLWVFNWAWNDSSCSKQEACYICEVQRRSELSYD